MGRKVCFFNFFIIYIIYLFCPFFFYIRALSRGDEDPRMLSRRQEPKQHSGGQAPMADEVPTHCNFLFLCILFLSFLIDVIAP